MVIIMHMQRQVSLFKNGSSQAIRIPREFELQGTKAIISKEGSCLIIEPIRKGKLLSLLETLEPIEDQFPDIDEGLSELDSVDL